MALVYEGMEDLQIGSIYLAFAITEERFESWEHRYGYRNLRWICQRTT